MPAPDSSEGIRQSRAPEHRGGRKVAEGVTYSGAGLSQIDGKGRVTMPAQLRSAVERSNDGLNTLYLSLHPELPCLIGYGVTEQREARSDRQFQRNCAIERGESFDLDAVGSIAASELSVNFEANGRFVMPPMLRGLGELEDKALFYGSTWYFCIWNPTLLLEQGEGLRIPKKIAQHYLEASGAGGK